MGDRQQTDKFSQYVTGLLNEVRICELYYPSASVVLSLQTLSVASSKLTASSRPTAPLAAQPSASDSANGEHCAL